MSVRLRDSVRACVRVYIHVLLLYYISIHCSCICRGSVCVCAWGRVCVRMCMDVLAHVYTKRICAGTYTYECAGACAYASAYASARVEGVHVRERLHVCVRACVYAYVCARVRLRRRLRMCMCVRVRVRVRAWARMRMRALVRACVYIYV